MKKSLFYPIIGVFLLGTFMQTVFLTPDTPPTLPACVLTIGNFDGVHLGHQAMLNTLNTTAKANQLATAVMIFEPQPREFFSPDTPPARLSNFAEKVQILSSLEIDILIVATFDDTFRSLSATEFTTLLHVMNVKQLVLGDDFRFGHDRAGDSQFLAQSGFGVANLPTINYQTQRISSTLIRKALAIGDLNQAAALLGRPYSITGKVSHGDKIGRTLGFPTANIALDRLKPALHGVFAVDVMCTNTTHSLKDFAKNNNIGIDGTHANSLFAAASIGTRPSVNGTEYRLEVYLPEFEGDLYGLTLKVVFLHFLHGERTYDSLDSLKTGIYQDVMELTAWRQKISV